MQLSGQPTKPSLVIASGAGAAATIPVSTPVDTGRATQLQGFPPETRLDPVAGGVPPSGLDMNGLLNLISGPVRWLCGGGGFQYDAAWAGSPEVGGYPKGARILNTAGTLYYRNTVDGNTTDPNAGGAGWARDGIVGTADYITVPYVNASTGVAAELIVQWGLTAIIPLGGAQTITYPRTFPNNVYAMLTSPNNDTDPATTTSVRVSNSQGRIYARNAPTSAFWIAIGD